MMAVFSQVVHLAANESNNAQLGTEVRTLLDNHGGVERFSEQYKQVSAYHNKNHLPLLWNIHCQHRAAIFGLLSLLDIQAATQVEELTHALRFLQQYQHARRDNLPPEIDLHFASNQWKTFVHAQHNGQTVLKRRELELCILSYVGDGLRCGDLYVSDSEEFSDYRQQLLSWERMPEAISGLL